MYLSAIIVLLIGVAVMIPIILWGYIFSYIEGNRLSRKRFVVGLVGGAISVVPILYLDKILETPGMSFLNIFFSITQIGSASGLINFIASLSLFLFILAGLAFIAISWSSKSKKILKIYIKNIVLFILFILLMSLGIYLFAITGIGYGEIEESTRFGEVVFNTLKLIIFYYILVAFIEETSKHFNFLQSSVLEVKTVESGVLYAIFVALGFAFIENILYLYTQFKIEGLSGGLFSVYFYRSIFSIMLHVMCSAIVGYSFSKAYLLCRKKIFSLRYMKIFFVGLLSAVLLHMIFDVALTLGFSFVIILYFVIGYLYISSIFYKE